LASGVPFRSLPVAWSWRYGGVQKV
jgi:hypothetical protein